MDILLLRHSTIAWGGGVLLKTEFSFCFPPRLESLIQIVWIYGPGLLLLNSTPMQALLPGILAMTPWPAGRIGQMRIFVALSWLMCSIELLWWSPLLNRSPGSLWGFGDQLLCSWKFTYTRDVCKFSGAKGTRALPEGKICCSDLVSQFP